MAESTLPWAVRMITCTSGSMGFDFTQSLFAGRFRQLQFEQHHVQGPVAAYGAHGAAGVADAAHVEAALLETLFELIAKDLVSVNQ